MFPRRFWVVTGLYAVLIAATLPLALRLVPPNSWYGFRLPGLRFDPALWYDINALGGRNFVIAMVVCAGINALIHWKGTPAILGLAVWINGALIVLAFWLVSLDVLAAWPY